MHSRHMHNHWCILSHAFGSRNWAFTCWMILSTTRSESIGPWSTFASESATASVHSKVDSFDHFFVFSFYKENYSHVISFSSFHFFFSFFLFILCPVQFFLSLVVSSSDLTAFPKDSPHNSFFRSIVFACRIVDKCSAICSTPRPELSFIDGFWYCRTTR